MLKENEFMIDDWKSFKIEMSFEVITWDGEFQADVEVSCAEDIQEVMKLFFNKDWIELFHNYNERYYSWAKDVTDAALEGIYIVAKEVDKGHIYFRLDSRPKVTASVNLENMGDKNAKKINEIRSILNK